MQLDFHFYCVGVLAKGAGFNSADALTIAYASQYVDNSTESELIPITQGDKVINFDPVLTTYDKFDAIEAISWSAQKRVWIPFHFIPTKPFDPHNEHEFSFITTPKSSFASLILENAAKEPLKNHNRRLCRIGVALHTYADTWSHQGFSGRKYHGENDVEDIRIYDRKRQSWNKLRLENILFDILPQIGHGEAGYFPDLTFQKWRYLNNQSKDVIQRDNLEDFTKAAKDIYHKLLKMKKTNPTDQIPWTDLEPKIKKLFGEQGTKPGSMDRLTLPLYRAYQANQVNLRCKKWVKEFSQLFGENPDKYSFNPKAWREAAFHGNVDWDKYTQDDWAHMHPRTVKGGFWDSLWVNFHRAALAQRHFVLENVP